MKNDKDLFYQGATELVSAMTNKKISSVELLEETISRIEILDKKINAVVVRDFEQARLVAKAADAAIERGERKPLLGLPITVKESFNVAGLPTTWGNPQYKNWIPNADALSIARLKKAGAIIIGKTNVPFMLMDYQSYNDIYGTTNNPYNINFTPGGSSGGSAAALAAGFVSLELGSDLGGSVRVPAHYCGIFGHKPSFNLVPMRGGGPPTSPPSPHLINDLGVAGPMARTAADLALALEILAGPDEIWDGKGYKLSLPPARHNDLNKYRVLVINTHPLCPTAESVNKSIDNLVKHLISLGVKTSHDIYVMPDLAEITRTFVALFSAFVAGNMPIDEYQRTEAAAKMLPANDISLEACFLRGCTLTYRDWLMKIRTREVLRQQWRALFKEFDVVICPVMPTPALPHDHSNPEKRQIEIDGVLFPFSNQYAWISIATLFGLPATVLPISQTENSLPIGVQVIGDYLEDYTTIQFANLIERELGSFSIPNL
jgi:amidase